MCSLITGMTAGRDGTLSEVQRIGWMQEAAKLRQAKNATLVQHATVSHTPVVGLKSSGTDVKTPKVFICYRRVDSEYPAHSIYETLVSHFGKEAVFFDVDSIPLGVKFHGILNEAVANATSSWR